MSALENYCLANKLCLAKQQWICLQCGPEWWKTGSGHSEKDHGTVWGCPIHGEQKNIFNKND